MYIFSYCLTHALNVKHSAFLYIHTTSSCRCLINVTDTEALLFLVKFMLLFGAGDGNL